MRSPDVQRVCDKAADLPWINEWQPTRPIWVPTGQSSCDALAALEAETGGLRRWLSSPHRTKDDVLVFLRTGEVRP